MIFPAKNCLECGELFTPKSTSQQYCNRIKEKVCPICGRVYSYKCSNPVKQTCSKECGAKLIKITREQNANRLSKRCKFCGKLFHPRDTRDFYCEGPHFKTCVICENQFEINVRTQKDRQTCSEECKKKLMTQNHDYERGATTYKQNVKAKYGVDSVMQIPEVVEKLKATNRERYGSDWYTQTDEYREKVIATSIEKYGVEHHLKSEEVMSKREQTNLQRYGVANVFQSTEVKKKIRNSNNQKYGYEYISQVPKIQDKIVASNIDKYGVKHPMMLKEFQNKAMATNIERYGRVAYTQQHIENIQLWYQFTNDPSGYIESHYLSKPRTAQLASDLGVDESTIDVYLNKADCFDHVRRARSLMEECLADYIHSIDSSIRIVTGSKSIISPYELDLYLPDYNFAIECDPTVTHNSSIADPWGGSPKDRKYHWIKTNKCEEKGIFLFHIFGYDWSHSKEVILSMILNKLNKSLNAIYARKCSVGIVEGSDAIQFLNTNHRQGSANSPVRLGLYYNDQLVALMTFGKMRSTIGTGNDDTEDCWELVRFCSLLNTTIVGGASKLFTYFVKNYNPQRIRSFSDRAHTSGRLYSQLGFLELRRSDPGYMWVDTVTDVAYHRANAQKANLKKFLKDDNIDLNKTEKEIMESHGFVQVFDSGTITWEWRSP